MIGADQIPPEVVEAAAQAAWKLKDQRLWEILKATQPDWKDEARATIAAIINAWPGSYSLAENDSAEIRGVAAIILPLPQEARDE